jgi:dTDP-4-dehydrorhamnose 3,5-epimerase-like enzyme
MISKIDGGLFADDRGFLRFVNGFDFSKIKRFYQVEKHKKEGKYIYVASGTALIGLVNLETEEVSKFTLTSQKPCILCVPPGYANGFKTLEDNTIIMFYSTSTLEESKGDDYRFDWDKWDIWQEDYR